MTSSNFLSTTVEWLESKVELLSALWSITGLLIFAGTRNWLLTLAFFGAGGVSFLLLIILIYLDDRRCRWYMNNVPGVREEYVFEDRNTIEHNIPDDWDV